MLPDALPVISQHAAPGSVEVVAGDRECLAVIKATPPGNADPGTAPADLAALREQADASATYCDFNLIDPHSRVVRRVPTPDFNYRDMLVTVTCPPGPGAFFRRYTFARAGPWDPSLRQMPDYDFWLRLGLQGRFVRIPKVLAGFRIHDASQTFSVTNEARADEPVLIVSRLLDRADLPDDVLRCRSEALSRARLVSAQRLC